MKAGRLILTACLALILGGVLALGCQSQQPFAGKYQSVPKAPGEPSIVLELESDGKGSWKAGDQPKVTFRWEIKKDKIWIHGEGGGVLIGTPAGKDELSLDMSGDIRPEWGKHLQFKRMPAGK
jgi:hypothetical protein